MLRMVLSARRRTVTGSTSSEQESDKEESEGSHIDLLEPWPVFLMRTAQWTDQQLEKAGLCQWHIQWKKKKWMWAARLAESDNKEWSSVATQWQPLLHSRTVCGRRQARPKKRWDQDIMEYIAALTIQTDTGWLELARDKDWWQMHTNSFATA